MTFLWRLRVLLFYFLVSIWSCFCCSILFILHIFGANYNIKYIIAYFYSLGFLKSLKITCNIDYVIEGRDNIPSKSCVIALNHQSFWDNIVVVAIFPKQSWVMKRELFKIPFFGWGLKMMDTIAVDRSNDLSVAQILKKGTEKLKQNISIIIFPEGTRLNYGDSRNFKPSFAKLAISNNVAILPVVHNAGLYWPKGFWLKQSGVIKIKIGAPIQTCVKDDAREMSAKIQNWINEEKSKI
jgi:1-acyl-sn-glycerol-3-phosphate acyltransferase